MEEDKDSNENLKGNSVDEPINIREPPKRANTWKPNPSRKKKRSAKKKIPPPASSTSQSPSPSESRCNYCGRTSASSTSQSPSPSESRCNYCGRTLASSTSQSPSPSESRCNYCGRTYAAEGKNHGTGNQINHLNNQCTVYPGNVNEKQKNLVLTKAEGSDANLKQVSYSYERCRSKLIKMIIIDEFAFKVVEGEGFVDFIAELQPRFTLPSRVTVSRDCMKLYVEMKQTVKKLIKSERVCLTTDTWTSIQNINYMCLTAHWIDKDWKLQKRILSFSVIPNHKGKTLGKMIENRLLDWGIEKLLTVTVDNASSNDGAINYLKKNTKAWKTTILDHDFLHMRCCAHILNLIVRDGLKHQSESIFKIRNAIRYVRSSPARTDSFKKCVAAEKIESKRLLCLDIETRWNSTYLMLETALKFEKAFERLKEDDLSYRMYFACGGKEVDEGQEPEIHEDELVTESREKGKGKCFGPPHEIDWDAARSFVKFLKLFYDVTLKFSGTLNVTSNVFFQQLVGIQTALQNLSKTRDPNVALMALKMQEKFSKYWENLDKLNFLLYVAVILDPRFKLKFVKFCLDQIYESDQRLAAMMLEEVKNAFNRLHECYLNCDDSQGNQKSPSRSNKISNDIMDIDDLEVSLSLASQFEKHLEETEGFENKSEFDKYLDETCAKNYPSFDVLDWWSKKYKDFPVLSRMAMDVLAIPVSTVASESTFSTSGRVLDHYKSSLNPEMVEALICCQNWLRSNHASLDVQESMKEVSMEEVEKYEEVVKDFRRLGVSRDKLQILDE